MGVGRLPLDIPRCSRSDWEGGVSLLCKLLVHRLGVFAAELVGYLLAAGDSAVLMGLLPGVL